MDEHGDRNLTDNPRHERNTESYSGSLTPGGQHMDGFALEKIPLSAIRPHPLSPRIGEDPDIVGPLDIALFVGGEGIHAGNAPLLRRLPSGELQTIRGERRIAAARRASSEDASLILAYVAEGLDDAQAYRLTLSGHSQLELTKLEIGILAHRAQQSHDGVVTQRMVAEQLGEDPANVSKYKTAAVLFLTLKEQGLLDCNSELACRDRAQHLYRIAEVADLTLAAALVTRCIDEDWSIATTDTNVREALKQGAKPNKQSRGSGGNQGAGTITPLVDTVGEPPAAQGSVPSPSLVPSPVGREGPEIGGAGAPAAASDNVRPDASSSGLPAPVTSNVSSSIEAAAAGAGLSPSDGDTMASTGDGHAVSEGSAKTDHRVASQPGLGVVTPADAALAFHQRRVNLRGEVDVAAHAAVLGFDLPADAKIGIGMNRIVLKIREMTNEGRSPSPELLQALAVVVYWEFLIKSPVFRDYARLESTKKSRGVAA